MRVRAAGCVLTAIASVVSAAGGASEEWADQAVAAAVEKAKEALWSEWADGHWPEPGSPKAVVAEGDEITHGGYTALAAYALLSAGESPQGERMSRTLEWLAKAPMEGTYARAMRANVWGRLGPKSKYRANLAADVEWLVRAMDGEGGYYYYPSQRAVAAGGKDRRRYDNSNSQLAVLGVWAGAAGGLPIPRQYWQRVEQHWIKQQEPDGGWSYRKGHTKDKGYGSMTTAGLATLFLCFDALYAEQFANCKTPGEYPPITRGLEWMNRNFSATDNPGMAGQNYHYYLYGVERVGLAGGHKYFGEKDWYKLGARALVDSQQPGGGWGNLRKTSFGLLFLARGRSPVLFNKLRYEGAWNSRPRDLANLTGWITATFERPVNWQIVGLQAPVGELHDAPILYVSGAAAPKFSSEEIDKLRLFVQQGGTVLSEPACNSTDFSVAMRRFYEKMFPALELKVLPPEHPIYSVHFKTGGRLMGIHNGVRLLAIHSPADLSRAWHLNQVVTQRMAFEQAANIYFFVTDKGSLRNRGVSGWPAEGPFTPAFSVKVATVTHRANWSPEPLAWKRFALLMGGRHRVSVEVSDGCAPERLDAGEWPVAAITGTNRLELTGPEREALGKYVRAGGTLVVDACGGSAAFADSAEAELSRVFPDGNWSVLPPEAEPYAQAGAGIEKVGFRRAARPAPAQGAGARLRAITLGGRAAVIFSADDLTAGLVGYPCWGLAGYEPETAFQLMRNIVLYASKKKLTP